MFARPPFGFSTPANNVPVALPLRHRPAAEAAAKQRPSEYESNYRESSEEKQGDIDVSDAEEGQDEEEPHSKYWLPPVMAGDGKLEYVEDLFSTPPEEYFFCHVHKRDEPASRLIYGTLLSMFSHYDQWHASTLREGMHDTYDMLYVKRVVESGANNRGPDSCCGPDRREQRATGGQGSHPVLLSVRRPSGEQVLGHG